MSFRKHAIAYTYSIKKQLISRTISSGTSPTTMPAKSLGTLPVIYAVDEQQNPLPRKTMLFEGDMNSTGGENKKGRG